MLPLPRQFGSFRVLSETAVDRGWRERFRPALACEKEVRTRGFPPFAEVGPQEPPGRRMDRVLAGDATLQPRDPDALGDVFALDERRFPATEAVAVDHLEEQPIAGVLARNRGEEPLHLVFREIDDLAARGERNDVHFLCFSSVKRDLDAFVHFRQVVGSFTLARTNKVSSLVSLKGMEWIAVCALVIVLGGARADAQSITVTTFAGPQEVPGVSDGTGREARFGVGQFGGPMSLAVDRQGNLYVADQDNLSIRRISPAGGVTTIAGHFYIGGGVDGPGSTARFYFPQGVATDGADNIYVADTYNSTIRKITAQGIVSTVAGLIAGSTDGQGTKARFYRPAGLTVAADGTIYVADTGNHTIRKVTPAGSVTTLAGVAGTPGYDDGIGSSARFYYPNAITLDESGNLYVADTWSHAIRKVTPDGTVSTYCGARGFRGTTDGPCAAARFAYPEGIAIAPGGDLYVADTFNYCVRKIDRNGVVSTVAGSPNTQAIVDGPVASARFSNPSGIVVDTAGAIYVMDGTLRKIINGEVRTVAGLSVEETRVNADGAGAAARFESSGGIAADSNGSLYLTDEHTVRKVTPAAEVSTIAGRPGITGNAIGPAASASFDVVRGIAVVGDVIYVSDRHNQAIKKIAGGTVSIVAGINSPVEGEADGPGSTARFRHPEGIVADAAGNIYVADGGNHTIRKITAGGVVSTLAGSARQSGTADGTGSAARFNTPLGVAVDGSGNVYVTDSGNYTVRKITPSGQVTTLAGLAGSTGFVDGVGNVARFKFLSYGIAAAQDGTVFVGDDATMRRIDPDGKVTTIAGTPNSSVYFGQLSGSGHTDGTGDQARLSGARGIVVMPNGNLFFSDNASVRLGHPTIPDAADGALTSTNPEVLQLTTSAQTATEWDWRIMRRPADARATLSSTTSRTPTFRSDVPGLFVFRLTASGPAGARVSYLEFMSNAVPSPPPSRRRAARH